jgi:glycosyltransferase involved in cell wall biosynthesis
MNNDLKISVITVCYNSADHIADAIRSVDAQTWPHIEHLVIDGASKDGTLAIVQSHLRPARTVISEPDKGIYDAMNKGLRLASGDVIGFLNSDDFYADPQALERVAQAFADPQVDAVYGDIVFVSREDDTRVVRLWTSRPYTQGLCATGWMPPHPSLYVRRSAYEQYGDYDTAFPAAADFEMSLRLLDKAQLKSAYIPFVQVRMRMGGQSTGGLRNIMAGSREVSRACRKHGLPGGLGFVLKRLLVKVPQFLQRPKQA